VTVEAGHDLLVGRDAEIAQLAGLVQALARGRGGAVWVEGEPGIGKSALLTAGLADAEHLGCRVFWATADELGMRFPLRVLLDCLRVVPGTADRARQEILALLEAGGGDGAGATDPLPAVVERLLALVDRLCAAPTLLVIDDLHWADDLSLVVWQQLSRAVPQQPLLLVVACRPIPRRAEVDALRRTAATSGAVLMTLEALPPDLAVDVAGGLLGVDSIGPTLRQAVGQAGGNPLYVREIVDALTRELRLRRERGIADLVEESGTGAPVSLTAAISARLGFVSAETSPVLQAAALLGGEFSVADLAVTMDTPAIALAPAVAEAMAAGLLVESGARLAFRHALIRQVLLDRTPAAVRAASHRQAARALADAGAAVERVAEQLLAAPAEPDPGLAVDAVDAVDAWTIDWLTRQGRALSYRSPTVAAELLGRAVEYAAADDPHREDLEAVLAPVLVVTGRREEAVRLAERVCAVTGDPARAAEMSFTRAWALHHLLCDEQAAAVLAEALRDPRAGAGGTWTVRLKALRAVLPAEGGDIDEAAAAEDALAEAERAGDRFAAALASHAVGASLFHRGNVEGALTVVERALAMLGEDVQTADLRVLMLQNRLAALDELDRLIDADPAARELVAVAERFAPPHRLVAARVGAAIYHFSVGQWDDALAELEAIAGSGFPLAPIDRPLVHGLWALIAAHRDDEATAETHLSPLADQPVTAPGSSYAVQAHAALAERRGEPERALALLAEVWNGVRRPDIRRSIAVDLVRLALAAGDLAVARSVSAAASGTTPSWTATADHCGGLVDRDPARLLAATDIHRGTGRRFELAQALEDAAVLLAERGDPAGSRTAFAEAGELYAALGADWDARRADARVRPYGIRRGRRRPGRPARGWAALTPTELEVARLVADGQSNPDIAARLFLSRRTVEVHVSHILAKLDARSRVEIAKEAAAH
jgi:DNA-binding CsgD family transcriptional regulator/tetratricopeptide (TPR) repeat protein